MGGFWWGWGWRFRSVLVGRFRGVRRLRERRGLGQKVCGRESEGRRIEREGGSGG